MSNATTIAIPTEGDPLFYAASFLARYKGETRATYTIRLRIFYQWCQDQRLDPIHGITRTHLELFGRYLETTRRNSPATVHGGLSVLVKFYELLVVDGVIAVSPAAYVRRPKIYRDEVRIMGLERNDVMKLLQAGRRMSADHSALITLLAVLGLRVSEACSVKVGDFIEHERGHRVLRLVGKGGKPATIPLPPSVFRELDRCIEQDGTNRRTDRLLMRIDGVTPLDRGAAYRMVKAVGREAGITARLTPHVLRHSMVSAALDAGVPLRDVQIAARHADPRTTANYDHARRSLDRHAVHVVSAYLSGGTT